MRVVLQVRLNATGQLVDHECADLHEADEMAVEYSERGDQPWAILVDGKTAFDAATLARMIRHFVIHPQTLETAGR